jgi:hypothetical protein
MTSLSRRLQRLEATTAWLDSLGRQQELDEFSRTAVEYVRAVRQYLGEPPDEQIPISCGNESELVNQVVAYRIRSLRHYRRQRNAYAECQQAGKLPVAEAQQVQGSSGPLNDPENQDR